MQRDAENRVREMQSRARLLGEQEFSSAPVFYQNKKPPQQNPFSEILGKTDSDTLIILPLLWILWNEKADPKLLLALLYLLL